MTGPGFSIHILSTMDEMVDFLVRKWQDTAESAIARAGIFTAALSGGSTPSEFYRRLAILKGDMPWEKTHIFPADERFVPLTDTDSNIGMMKSLFLKEVNLPEENIHAVMTDAASPSEAAECYEQELKRFFALSDAELPRFDLICLGIGEDGHTASLFPGASEAEVPLMPGNVRLAVPVEHDLVKHSRISLTLPVINNAETVIVIVAGKHKATIVKRVVGDRDQGFPAGRVEPSRGRLLFVLDTEAASILDK
ncbi:MAG TPA: 6-phosphogluconolactonase [Dissulfurispiraceae bacterium]|nr:6-phosphogluconolactonase [Dissulfurispiraceae bacterium]